MNNIEKMERMKNKYSYGGDYRVITFMELCIDALKDLHEENARLGKQMAEMVGIENNI